MFMFKIIVAASSSFTDYDLFRSKLDHLLQNKDDVEICSGFSLAGDALTDTYSGERDVTVNKFDPGFRGMYRALVYAEAALFFHDGVSTGTAKYIEEARQCRLKVKIVTFTPVKAAPIQGTPPNELDTAIPAGKPRPRKNTITIAGEELTPETKSKTKKKPIPVISKYDYKKIYQDVYEAHFKTLYPAAHRNGHFTPHKMPNCGTANGLTSYIIDHLTWTGHYANRINVMGRQIGGITKTASGATFDDRKFIKASTKKGSEDIDCIIFKRPVKFEVKLGADYQKDKQKEHEAKVKRAGGDYRIIKTVDDYLNYYYQASEQKSFF